MNKLNNILMLCAAAIAGVSAIPFTTAQALVGSQGWWSLSYATVVVNASDCCMSPSCE